VSEAVKEKRLVLELVGDARAPVELPRAGALSIGSSKAHADMLIEGQGVADVHCAIKRIKGGGWALQDLGSEFGTFVNGEKVLLRRLEVGDQLLVGSRRLRVIDPEQPPAPVKSAAPPPPPPPPPTRVEPPPQAAPAPRPATLGETAPRLRTAETSPGGLAATQVKGYRIERALGRGGMGEVYLAVQESLDRRVALKVLASKLAADADFVRRFQAEARAAAALNHPNVVTVHDVWEENGRHFLSMEFMDKGNLETRVARDGRITAAEALDILADAAKALVYAEMRGIVHRDIKPANLMQNSAGATKLADLGLATHLEAEATESDNKKIYGTPHFISPEQARGERVDCRSDLYSLGATVYRLLSGHTPFEGATTRDILRGHFFEEPKPLAELAPDVPPDLARIVHRLLKKKPDERFLSAGVLLQEVERLRSGAVHAGAPGAAHKKSKTGLIVVLASVAVALFALMMLLKGKGGDSNGVSPSTAGANPGGNPGHPVEAAPGGNPTPNLSPAEHVDPTPTGRPRDDDTALKLRETEAALAFANLPHDLTSAERQTELLRLAKEFEGTTKAGEFATEAEALHQAALREDAAASEHERQVGETLERVRRCAFAGDKPLPLGDALRAMLTEPAAAELVADPGFVARRKQLMVDVVHATLDRGRAMLADVDRAVAAGEFNGLDQRLRPWLDELDLHAMPSDFGPAAIPELSDVNGLRDVVRTRLDSLDQLHADFTAHKGEADRGRIAATYHSQQGLESELRHLDFAAADARLTKLESELETPDARAFAAAQRASLRLAQKALETLGGEFDKGTWIRKQVIDPRAKSRVNRDALGANAQGVLLKVNENTEFVPWAAFGTRAGDLHQLFHKRLSREYTHDELVGIEFLVRTAAVLQAVDQASDVLMPDKQSILSDEEARSMVDGFDLARIWGQLLGDTSACDSESQAAHMLADALHAKGTAAWSAAVTLTERLLAEHPSTLIVRFLSDGRGAKAPSPKDNGGEQFQHK
jgi:serine/threonine protein kinase